MSKAQENTSRTLNYAVLNEKYRPITLDEMILPEKYMKKFEGIVKSNSIPNMLFYSSSPGVGKTTLAKILANLCDVEWLYINNSLERGIDTLRSKISRFASSLSFGGKKKLVILDEFDGSTPELQNALRGAIEAHHKVCSFICTCNYITKISDALQSRLTPINFDFTTPSMKKEIFPKIFYRLMEIIEAEEMAYDDKKTIKNLVIKNYPDVRKMIGLIVDCYTQNGIINNDVFTMRGIHSDFYQLVLNKKFTLARQYVLENNIDLIEVYTFLMKNLLDKKMITDANVRGHLYILFSDYCGDSVTHPNREMLFCACLMEMFKII
jgi:replication factor C small subunit